MDEYKFEKIKVLLELGVKLTNKELKRIVNAETEIQLDNYARDLTATVYKPVCEKRVWCGLGGE